MSLAVLADHMASKGRGPDSMLIHMSPTEVQGLQALAMKNGGSLTINPETGLPEAGFLDKLLPAIIGFGLNYFVPGLGSAIGGALGTSAAVGTGLAVGGVQALRTGDIGKGIAAGLGAYGGAGLSEGLMAAGSTEAGLSSGALSAELAQGAQAGMTPGESFNSFLTSDANPAVSEALKNATPFERMSAGFDAAKANPSSLLTKDNFKYLGAAAAPILADQAVTAKGPQTTTKPGMIRPYSFDPYGGSYTAGTPYEAQVKKAAGGGLMGMDNGGYNPGQLNFAQQSEPVMRMARGGVAHFEGGGNTADVGSGGGDAALAAYQSGDYATASRLLGEAGMSAQDVVSKYGLSQADAATVAQNLGYTGNMSGLQYTSPAPPAVTAPVDYFANQFAPDVNNPVVTAPVVTAPVVTDTSGGLAALNTAATNTAATNTAATNTDTSGGLAALNTAATTPYYFQVNPDVAAEYARNPMGLTPAQFAQAHYTNFGKKEGREFEPSAAVNYATANKTDIVANTLKWIDTNPFATPEQITAAITGSGMSKGDVTRALDSLVASGKISGSERYYIQQGKGLSGMADNTAKWLKDNPNATQTQIDAVLKAANMDIGDAQQVLAHGFQVADKDLIAATKYIQDNPDVARWITSTQGQAYVKAHPEFDAKDIAFTHYERYGKKEGRKWGEDTTKTTTTTTGTGTGTTIIPGVNTVYGTGGSGTSGSLESVYGPSLPPGVSGAGITTVNPNGTITTRPNIPGIPEGGFKGMTDLRKAYTDGGGSLGYVPYAPKTIDEFNTKYNKLTGGSKQAYDYLTGKTLYDPTPNTKTGEIMKPYFESVGRFPENRKAKKYVYVDGKYQLNPDYVKPSYVLAGEKAAADKAAAAAKAEEKATTATTTGSTNDRESGGDANGGLMRKAVGGLAALTMAGGGMPEQFNLGGYSDGGRLLRGPGDGVSDSIPATIGNKRPARLADGEFVVPARIVSELGNGSTEAGARKLYAMMDRVQKARRGTVGKGRVAKNSRSEKYLPA
jgi:hypothetical protein